jgi:class 3 adenylate cyclase
LSVLNRLFSRFDNLLNYQKTLTKIKTISDCYIAAGGIFPKDDQTPPQPAEHTKELVSFGLDSIRALQDMNKEMHTRFEMRAGAAIGQIQAGIVGLGRPSFEIVGPPIKEAREMEQSGTPMIINITRRVYEIIYGDCFEIRPNPHRRGPHESYIVTGRISRQAA